MWTQAQEGSQSSQFTGEHWQSPWCLSCSTKEARFSKQLREGADSGTDVLGDAHRRPREAVIQDGPPYTPATWQPPTTNPMPTSEKASLTEESERGAKARRVTENRAKRRGNGCVGEGRMWEAGGGLTPMEALFQLGSGVEGTRTQLWPHGWIPCAGSRMVWSSGRGQVGRTGGHQGTVGSGHHERKQSHVPGGGDKGQSGDSGLRTPKLMLEDPTDGQTGGQLHPRELLLEPSRTLCPSFPHTHTRKGPSTPPVSLCRKAESPRPPRVTKEWLQQLVNTA